MTVSRGPQLRGVVEKIDPGNKLLRRSRLDGGISAQVTALETRRANGETKRMVVRRHGAADLAQNPHIARDEFKLLQVLQSAELPAPSPLLLDESGEIFSTPYLVTDYIEGDTEFEPADLDGFLDQFANCMARIHRVSCHSYDLSFLPEQRAIYTRKLAQSHNQLDTTLQVERIKDTLVKVWPLPQRNRRVLLHGDFWPGNLLWRQGQLVGIIDWEDAQIGDPLADLANASLETLWAFGVDAMHSFVRYYKSAADVDVRDLPLWNLLIALRHACNSARWPQYRYDEQVIRSRYLWFVNRAFSELSV